MYNLLIINPGSTSTKVAVYQDEQKLMEGTIRHSGEELDAYSSIYGQLSFRKELILKLLQEKDIDLKSIGAVVGRGGMLRPIEGGTYAVNQAMLDDLRIGVQGQHASNLGGIIAHEIAESLNVPAFIVDPVVVDEMDPVARISGFPEIKRRSIFHALNQKAVAKRYARESSQKYEDLNLIVAHLGGGVSVGVHKYGRVVDVNNALDGEGPFSPERSGGVPIGDLVRLCYSGEATLDEMQKRIVGEGGFMAFLNTNDVRTVTKLCERGNEDCRLKFEAFIYQVSKEIGSCATVLCGNVDAIILTGGIAYGKEVTDAIQERVSYIGPIIVYPGEDEMLALAQGALRVLCQEENVKIYFKSNISELAGRRNRLRLAPTAK